MQREYFILCARPFMFWLSFLGRGFSVHIGRIGAVLVQQEKNEKDHAKRMIFFTLSDIYASVFIVKIISL